MRATCRGKRGKRAVEVGIVVREKLTVGIVVGAGPCTTTRRLATWRCSRHARGLYFHSRHLIRYFKRRTKSGEGLEGCDEIWGCGKRRTDPWSSRLEETPSTSRFRGNCSQRAERSKEVVPDERLSTVLILEAERDKKWWWEEGLRGRGKPRLNLAGRRDSNGETRIRFSANSRSQASVRPRARRPPHQRI